MFADDILVFASRRLDIKAVKKAVAEYERIAEAKVHFDKCEGLRLDVRRGNDTLLESFRWTEGPVHVLGGRFGPTSDWSEICWKYRLIWMIRWEPGFEGGCP